MTNFDFLTTEPQFAAFSDVAVSAEKILNIDAAAVLNCRRAMEFAIKWMYSVDKDLKKPYDTTLVCLMNTDEFRTIIDHDLYERMDFIRKTGNIAAHRPKSISIEQAKLCIENLYYFMDFIACCYAEKYEAGQFDPSLLDISHAPVSGSYMELNFEELIKENKMLRDELTARRAEQQPGYVPKPLELSEYETRKIYIDTMLNEVGWIEGVNWENEVEMTGMPNAAEAGYADYVLYDDTHKPLAVIEAKRTCRDVAAGRQQAKLYADILEHQYGRRPVIFLTNGFETRIDDGQYPERHIAAIYSKRDLEKLFNLRSMRKNLKNIIIDKDIFNYFDAPLVGLTATPDDIDKNTYEIFELEDKVPTYGYELSQAVTDGYLVDYLSVESKVKFLEQGIAYDELSDEEKEEYEELFIDENGEVPERLSSSALNEWIFNRDTIRQVLEVLMANGIKIEYGEKLGKTIIFAKNHAHAEKILEVFNSEYPNLNGFAQVIDNRINYAQSLIDRFSDPKKLPYIAISVDMLDTGIDIPEVLNLVFFKKVMSKAKFWQMIGRGTRLCPGLLDGEDKSKFYIFDFCGNFEFFRMNKGKATANQIALQSAIFYLKAQIIFKLQDIAYQTDELKAFRKTLVSEMVSKVRELNKENFAVRQHQDNSAIAKLKNNQPLTEDDIEALEKILWSEVGTKEEYTAEYGEKPLGEFVREIVGLDMNAAKEAFSEFLNNTNLDAKQIYFVNQIVEYIAQNGIMKDMSVLQEAPFTDNGSIVEIFTDITVWTRIRKIIDAINMNAAA